VGVGSTTFLAPWLHAQREEINREEPHAPLMNLAPAAQKENIAKGGVYFYFCNRESFHM